jgi:hypothetical protein
MNKHNLEKALRSHHRRLLDNLTPVRWQPLLVSKQDPAKNIALRIRWIVYDFRFLARVLGDGKTKNGGNGGTELCLDPKHVHGICRGNEDDRKQIAGKVA